MPSTTYTTYPTSTRSHHSTRSRRSMSHSDYSPTGPHYGGSHHTHGSAGYPGTYAGGAYTHGSGGGRAYAYEQPISGHHRSSPQYYYPSSGSTRPHSRSPTYAHSTHRHDTRRYSTASRQPAYYVTTDAGHGGLRSTGHVHASQQQYGHRPTFGERLKWLFGMGHKNYHASGKRSREMSDSGRSRATHDQYGRHIYTV